MIPMSCTRACPRLATAIGGALLLGLASAPGAPAAEPYEKFYGQYVGEAVAENADEILPRDIGVNIAAKGKGFVVTWTVVIRKADGRVKRDETTITFQPSKREGIYSSAMRTDVFGNPAPLDPLRGDPYVWARIDGSTLTIHALIITDEGGYEMQVYERVLAPGGLDLRYSRVRDGTILRTVTGKVKKVR